MGKRISIVFIFLISCIYIYSDEETEMVLKLKNINDIKMIKEYKIYLKKNKDNNQKENIKNNRDKDYDYGVNIDYNSGGSLIYENRFLNDKTIKQSKSSGGELRVKTESYIIDIQGFYMMHEKQNSEKIIEEIAMSMAASYDFLDFTDEFDLYLGAGYQLSFLKYEMKLADSDISAMFLKAGGTINVKNLKIGMEYIRGMKDGKEVNNLLLLLKMWIWD